MIRDINYKTLAYGITSMCIALGVYSALHGDVINTALDGGLAVVNYKSASIF